MIICAFILTSDFSALSSDFAVYFIFYLELPTTKLGMYLENRVNSFLRKKDSGAGEVTIRVLSSYDKMTEVKPLMKAK